MYSTMNIKIVFVIDDTREDTIKITLVIIIVFDKSLQAASSSAVFDE